MVACAGLDPDGPCVDRGATLECPKRSLTFAGDGVGRDVFFKAPPGQTAPAAGWPVVFLFQGSFNPADLMWSATQGDALGAEFETATIRALLDAGFLVITPNAHTSGRGFWDTNVPGWSTNWEAAPDHGLMTQLFAALDEGKFGKADPTRLHAAGISSGGYMTSRMALSYPGRFRALAIQSASWATCAGSICTVPQTLPADHPRTLFLHGAKDVVVPIETMRAYRDGLIKAGKEAPETVDAEAGHAWISAAPVAIRDFFLR